LQTVTLAWPWGVLEARAPLAAYSVNQSSATMHQHFIFTHKNEIF